MNTPVRGEVFTDRAGWLSLLVLALVCLACHLLLVANFGLYTDDWWVIGEGRNVGTILTQWGLSQGRPLGYLGRDLVLNHWLASAPLPALYFASGLMLTLVAWLFYAVVRFHFGHALAAVSAILFLLLPQDVTQIHLTMMHLKFGLILVLVGILLYQRGHWLPGSGLAFLSLFCFESGFFLFLLAPWLRSPMMPLSQHWRVWLLHGLWCLALVALAFGIRWWVMQGEVSSRLGDNISTVRLTLGLLIYLWGSVPAWFGAMADGLNNVSLLAALPALLVLAALWWLPQRKPATEKALVVPHWEAALVGAGLLVAGLMLSGLNEFYPRIPVGTRETRVWATALFGQAMLLAVLLMVFWQSRAQLLKATGLAATLLLVLAMSAKSIRTQQDYAQAWLMQKSVYQHMTRQLTDLQAGDTVLLVSRDIFGPREKFTAMYPWGYPVDNLCSLLNCAAGGTERPRAAWISQSSFGSARVDQEGHVTFQGQGPWFRFWLGEPRVQAGRVIVFELRGSRVRRVNRPVRANGVVINKLRNNTASFASFPVDSESRFARYLGLGQP